MDRLTENKLILIVRETRLEELKARFNTADQARFYIQQLGGDFADYEAEDATYRRAVAEAQEALGRLGRVQVVHRAFLPNFIFGAGDIAVAVGQDGLVANTLKYLDGQPLIGVNPDPARYDGLLLPFRVADLPRIVPEVFRNQRPIKPVTMAEASLSNGQKIHAVNDLFIGPKSHGSARYRINYNGNTEQHSSSGVIVSTGLGFTGWLRSLITGAAGVAAAVGAGPAGGRGGRGPSIAPDAIPTAKWDADRLIFTVREPFPSRTTQATLVFGEVTPEAPLEIESFMAERGVIFSDGIEADFLEFNSGIRASIGIAERKGRLVA